MDAVSEMSPPIMMKSCLADRPATTMSVLDYGFRGFGQGRADREDIQHSHGGASEAMPLLLRWSSRVL